MTLILYPSSHSSKSQEIKITTDVERPPSSIICPITAKLLPEMPFVLLAPDFTSLTIDGQKATHADAREYSFILKVHYSVF
jgi:hypothetical protein